MYEKVTKNDKIVEFLCYFYYFMVKRRFSNFQKLTKINVFSQLQDMSHVKSLKSTKTCLKNGCLCSNKVMKNPTPLAPSVPYMGRPLLNQKYHFNIKIFQNHCLICSLGLKTNTILVLWSKKKFWVYMG